MVLPVRRAGGTPAALKLQPVDEETAGEPAALRSWAGHGTVRLLEHDPATGTMLLERLDPTRILCCLPGGTHALRLLSRLLARLVTVPAPPGLRQLSGIAHRMLERTPLATRQLSRGSDRWLLGRCAAAVHELLLASTG